jgi:hypothetical protein
MKKIVPAFPVSSVTSYKITVDEKVRWDYFKWLEYIDFLIKSGKKVEVVVRTVKKPSSSRQQRYYRGVVIPLIAEHTGYTVEETHGVLQSAGLWNDFLPDGKEYIRSTSEGNWTTVQWEERMENIRRWAMELNIYIPLPNECDDK